ncbi:hypothetical protein [Escherichia coli]|uniref:hypothetical protein n=1 Tax=Escherichia coli TaxID=562 RepID=UPI003D00E0FD
MKKDGRTFIRWFSFGCKSLFAVIGIGIAYYAAIGVFGLAYNPVSYYFSEWINWLQPKIKLPVTYNDSSLYLNDGTYSLGDYLMSVGYLLVMFLVQLYVAAYLINKLYWSLMTQVIIYKEGRDFHRKYAGISSARFTRLLSEEEVDMELEDISRKHWEKWKEHYKSNMSYDEWKRKFKNVL